MLSLCKLSHSPSQFSPNTILLIYYYIPYFFPILHQQTIFPFSPKCLCTHSTMLFLSHTSSQSNKLQLLHTGSLHFLPSHLLLLNSPKINYKKKTLIEQCNTLSYQARLKMSAFNMMELQSELGSIHGSMVNSTLFLTRVERLFTLLF